MTAEESKPDAPFTVPGETWKPLKMGQVIHEMSSGSSEVTVLSVLLADVKYESVFKIRAFGQLTQASVKYLPYHLGSHSCDPENKYCSFSHSTKQDNSFVSRRALLSYAVAWWF